MFSSCHMITPSYYFLSMCSLGQIQVNCPSPITIQGICNSMTILTSQILINNFCWECLIYEIVVSCPFSFSAYLLRATNYLYRNRITSSDLKACLRWQYLRKRAIGRTLLPVYIKMKKNTPVRYIRGNVGLSCITL